jgi:hypothetical protein
LTEKAVWHIVRDARKAGIHRLAPHDLRSYAESRTMPNQNAAPSLRFCGMDAAGHRLLRTMRHSPVVARLGEKLTVRTTGSATAVFATAHSVSRTGCWPGKVKIPRA